MKKKAYSKKQISEAIKYWQNELRKLNESDDGYEFSKQATEERLREAYPNMPEDKINAAINDAYANRNTVVNLLNNGADTSEVIDAWFDAADEYLYNRLHGRI